MPPKSKVAIGKVPAPRNTARRAAPKPRATLTAAASTAGESTSAKRKDPPGQHDSSDSSLSSDSDAPIAKKRAGLQKPGFMDPFTTPAENSHEVGTNPEVSTSSPSVVDKAPSVGKESAETIGAQSRVEVPSDTARDMSTAKQRADAIAGMRHSLQQLKRLVDSPDCALNKIKLSVEDLEVSVEVIQQKLEVLETEMDGTHASMTMLRREFTDLKEHVTSQVAGRAGAEPKESGVNEGEAVVVKEKGQRNNPLAATVRATLLGLMGVLKSNELPASLKSGFWTADIMDPETSEFALLRPRWHLHAIDNREWMVKVADIVKQDGKAYNEHVTQAFLDNCTNKQVMKAVKTTFNSWAKLWKDKQKSALAQASKRREQRHNKRARDKRDERRAVRDKVPDASGAQWNFLFELAYQSVDETDAPEDAENTDEDEDAEVQRPLARRAWISHPPEYRAAHVEIMRKQIDKKVFKARRHRTKNEPSYVLPRPRSRGDPYDCEIAKHKEEATRIPLEMVNPEWLARHPDQNRPTLIRDAIMQEVGSEEEPEVNTLQVDNNETVHSSGQAENTGASEGENVDPDLE